MASAKAIEIERFVEAEEIDPIYFQKAYYLVPEGTGVKAYHLLREAMADDGKVALAKVAFRDKEHLATLRLRDNVFVLVTLVRTTFPDVRFTPPVNVLPADPRRIWLPEKKLRVPVWFSSKPLAPAPVCTMLALK